MSEDLNSQEEGRRSPQELLGDIEQAPDSMALMAAVTAAEGSLPDKIQVFNKGHEAAVRLGDRDIAIMYGYRLTAEINAKAAVDMHTAVEGMNESSSRILGASQNMGAAADLIARSGQRY